jgi:hypothetical protein
MRPLVMLSLLGAWLGVIAPARAGLYLTAESEELRRLPNHHPSNFAFFFQEVRSSFPPAPGRKPSPRRMHYQKLAAELEGVRREGPFTAQDRADLGALYLRLGDAKKAIRVLAGGDTRHFQVQANLATAYFTDGDLEMALRHQRQVVDTLWPSVWVGWTQNERLNYRRCEIYFLKLLQARKAEQDRAARRGFGRALPVDPLFPGVRFVGPDRTYTAGMIAMRMMDRLPSDAGLVVLRLVSWLPQDNRLYWLLGELCNANGYVDAASGILRDIPQDVAGAFEDLIRHRQLLNRAMRAFHPLFRQQDDKTGQVVRVNQFTLLSALSPRGLLSPPGVGALAQEAASLAPIAFAVAESRPPPAPPEPEPVTPQSGLPDWRHVTVGFVSGALVAALAGLQWQEWRRRRQATPPPEDAPSPQGEASPAGSNQRTDERVVQG